ncbi:MAG: acyl--CoA ligase [Candidatus Obscuribacterales bacterium]|nr:acyl--CoA ligase [Candidatus Obscuribacterales bacterium]
MKEQPAQRLAGAETAFTPTEIGGTDEKRAKLSQDDVIRRLFTPASNLPEPRNNQAIMIITAGIERSVTHRQIENLIGYAIDQLKARGIKEGDKIVFYSENSPEFSSAILACWALNAMASLVDYRAERSEVLEISQKLGAKLLVTSKKLYRDCNSKTNMFTEEGIGVLDVTAFAEFKNTAPQSQLDINTIDLDRPAFTILTSGTTANPKAAVHNLRSLLQNIVDLAEAADLESNMTALMPIPISHIFGLSVFLVMQVRGVKIVLTELDPVSFVKAVHRHKPELIAALPQFYGALLSAPEGAIDLSKTRLLLCGGAPLTVALADKFEATFGKQLNNGYGSTESKLVTLNKGGPALSVGKPIGSAKVEIVNEQNEVLPEGKSGEVRITGPMLMTGYLDNEEESKKVLHDGHYYTGDIGRFEDGYLFVVGRKSDIIFVAGVVVQSGEVEEALRNNHNVKDVAVTALQNKRLGQIIKASVVIVDDKIGDKLKSSDQNERIEARRELQSQFKAYCEQHLSRYKRPMKWDFLGPHDNLPKSLAGKTDKKTM